jgi:hypothetical protein
MELKVFARKGIEALASQAHARIVYGRAAFRAHAGGIANKSIGTYRTAKGGHDTRRSPDGLKSSPDGD